MQIGISVSREDFFYDIHSLVKSFCPEDEVSIFSADDAEKSGRPYDRVIAVTVPDYPPERRRETKDALKRDLYLRLKEETGRELPWGMLSGIRPTRIPMSLMNEGGSFEDCVRHLTEHDFVSVKKARLAAEIAERERGILEELPLGERSYSLYIHVPFCPTICEYCTFSSSPAGVWKNRMGEYLDAVRREMAARRKRHAEEGFTGAPVSVYIGGGTPTALTAEELKVLLSSAAEIWNTDQALEYTVEAGRPDSFSPEKLKVLREYGVTRISVNPQTMNDETLKRIGRHHTSGDAERAFRMAREAGFENINMDIILGLPGEGRAEAEHTLARIEALMPDSLTVHSLAVKRASRLRYEILEDRMKDADADRGEFRGLRFDLPDEIMDLTHASAARMGMRPYYLYRQKNMRGNLENTGFAAPGRECLYNILIMEEVQTILAFGAGASTKYVKPGGVIEREVSPKDVNTYLDRNLKKYGSDC